MKISTTGPWLRPSLALALAYVVTGTLGLLLAVPPGYATAVWPPSGIALATILLVGPRALPGVALGSFAVNLGVGAELGDLGALLGAAPIAASIGCGAALEAAVGAALVRRHVGTPAALDTGRDVAGFLVLGGPVACLVNATWGTTTLYLAGAIDGGAVAFGWWTWWVGDVIGVITVAPLVLVALGEPRDVWSPRRTSLALPLAVTFALAVVLFVRVNELERARLATDAQQRARAAAGELERRIDGLLAPLRAAAHVPLAARGAYVDSVSAPPATSTWTPIAGAALGAPLAAQGDPRRLRVTVPLDGGVAHVTIDVAAIATALTPPLVADGFAVELIAHTPATARPFAIAAGSGHGPAPDLTPVAAPLAVAGQPWTLRLIPTDAYPGRHRTWAAWTVLAAGLVFTGVLGALLLVITGRTSRIESLVGARTRELAERAAALAEREAELRSSLRDKEVLLKEIHHRVKNNLQMISSLITLQALAVSDDTVRSQLDVTRERIRSMAMIHEQLYQSRDLAQVDLGDYAQALLGHLVTALALASRGIRLDSAIEPVPVSIDAAVPAGLLLAELVTNACKHAFPAGRAGTIRVGVARSADGRVELIVADDGVGIAPGAAADPAQTLGLELVATFVAQLDAELVMEPQAPTGTRARVSFAGG